MRQSQAVSPCPRILLAVGSPGCAEMMLFSKSIITSPAYPGGSFSQLRAVSSHCPGHWSNYDTQLKLWILQSSVDSKFSFSEHSLHFLWGFQIEKLTISNTGGKQSHRCCHECSWTNVYLWIKMTIHGNYPSIVFKEILQSRLFHKILFHHNKDGIHNDSFICPNSYPQKLMRPCINIKTKTSQAEFSPQKERRTRDSMHYYGVFM